ncbi:MAG: hypothetical protein ABMB14_40115, partial [Myxococcota bacterium]
PSDPTDPTSPTGTDTAPTGTTPPPPGNFDARCAAPGVVRCVGFDDPADLVGEWGDNHGTTPGTAAPALDPTQKASGASALLFVIPSNSEANSSGSWWTNFSDDLSVQFDGGDTFFVQWRQRFSDALITTEYAGGGGFKQAIIGTGDEPGCTASNSANGLCASSCTALEVVTYSYYQHGFPAQYNSCTGSTSHSAYDGFFEPNGAYDFLLQNARPDPGCRYSQGDTSYFPPDGNCFAYVADEWMTFQVGITLGPRVGDEFEGSRVRLWVAREGQPSELVIDWGPYNLTAGDAYDPEQRFGKVWLLPYNTGKDPSVAYPEAYTWYDELIVSTVQVADPL